MFIFCIQKIENVIYLFPFLKLPKLLTNLKEMLSNHFIEVKNEFLLKLQDSEKITVREVRRESY